MQLEILSAFTSEVVQFEILCSRMAISNKDKKKKKGSEDEIPIDDDEVAPF